MTDVPLALVWLLLPGLLPSVALIGLRSQAVPLAMMLSAIMASVSGAVALVASTSLLICLVITFLIVNVGSSLMLTKRKLAVATRSELAAGLAILVASFVPLLGLSRPLIDWDARSIWTFHARWFYAGGRFLRDALSNSSFSFSHSDYPPAIPASVGGLWSVLERVDLTAAQAVIGVLNFSAVALLGLAFLNVGGKKPILFTAPLGALAALGAFGIAGARGTNGYADLFWAAAATAAVIYLLVKPPLSVNSRVGLVCLVAAGLTKNEGLAVGVLILALALMRNGRKTRLLPWFGVCGLLMLSWPLIARLFGASSDLSGVAGRLLGGRIQLQARTAAIADALLSRSIGLGTAAVFCALVGAFWLRGTRRGMGWASDLWSWGAFIGAAVLIAGAYLISPHEIHWYLATSVDRTTIGLRLMLLAESLCWCVVGFERILPEPSPPRQLLLEDSLSAPALPT